MVASSGSVTQTLLLARRNVFRQRRRSFFALLIICGGVVTFMMAGGFILWTLEGMREATIHSQLGHIQVTRPGYFREGLGDPYSYLLPANTDAVTGQAPDGLQTVSPRLSFSGLLSKDDNTLSFIGEGIDPLLEAPIGSWVNIVAGRDLDPNDSHGVIVGVGLAGHMGLAPDDRVILLATTADGGINAVELSVSGLFQTTTKAYDDVALRVPIQVARDLMRVEGATSWVVLLDATAKTDAAVAHLRAHLSAEAFEIIPWSDLADFYNKTVELFTRQVDVVRLLIAIIVVLSISNTLSMAVLERTTEIGTSLALGVRRRGILLQFISEGALLGVVGGLIGIALGALLGTIVSMIGIPMPPPPGMGMGFIGEIAVTPALAADAFALAFVTTLAASIFPAWKASRMNIVDALRHLR